MAATVKKKETFESILVRAAVKPAAEKMEEKKQRLVDWVNSHGGRLPSQKSSDDEERKLGRFLIHQRNKKRTK